MMANDVDSKKIFTLYRNSSLLTKFHIWFRLKTCPFFSIEKFVPKEGIIIDYGCGHGIFANILSVLSLNRQIYGFDISKDKIEEANKTAKEGTKLKFLSNIGNLDGLVKKSDCIVILDVLSYFSDKERKEILTRIFNNLKPKTILIIKDIHKSFSIKYMLLFLQELIMVKILRITQANCLNFFKVEYLLSILQGIGFSVRVINLSKGYLYPHILFICKNDILNHFKVCAKANFPIA